MTERIHLYWDPGLFDLLIPVPLYPQRLRQRGFNQVLLLVKELSRRTGIPYGKYPPSQSQRCRKREGSERVFPYD
jgi:predicted amidophosphoribosyltransferase